MACPSVTSLNNICRPNLMAGIDKIYMIAFKDLLPYSTITKNVYKVASNGIVNDIHLAESKFYVEIGTLKNTVGFKKTWNKNVQNSMDYFTHSFNFILSDLSTDNKRFIDSIRHQPISILIKSFTDNYYVMGLNGLLELNSLDGSSGTGNSDLMGYNLSFEGISKSEIPLVDASIVNDLIGLVSLIEYADDFVEGFDYF